MPTLKNKESSSVKSTFVRLGASNHCGHERQKDDYYATDPIALELLLKKCKLPRHIWEPCCGEGHLSSYLLERGFDVFSSDLINRGFGVKQDFFTVEVALGNSANPDYAILTNPPFKVIDKFVVHALNLLRRDQRLFVFAKTIFLEGSRRYDSLFGINPPKVIYQFKKRVTCALNGDFKALCSSSAVSYAWFEWVKGFSGDPIVKWI